MFWILMAVFLVIWTMISRWKNRGLIALAKQLGPRSVALPIVGHAYRFLGNNEDRMKTFQKIGQEAIEKGGLISHWHGNKLYVFVADPDPAEILLKTCLEKDDVVRIFRILFGNGSIFAPVSIWRPRRKVTAQIFSPKYLNNFVDVFSRQSTILVDQLRNVAEKGAFSVWKYLTTYTMDSVCETALGIKMNAQLQPEQPFLNALKSCCRLGARRICQPWLHNDTLYGLFCNDSFKLQTHNKEVIWSFINKIITSRCEAVKKERLQSKSDLIQKNSLKSFLELLMDSSGDKGYSKVELGEETLVIVLAGTDTSAVGTAFTAVMLAKHPDVQAKVYQELQDVFGDSDRPVTPDDLPRLKYLDAVIKETLRLYPPVPFIVRKVHKDVTLPSGITLLKGCGIFISIWSIHRNPHYWGHDAEQFRPERFIDTPLKHPAAFMPFSHGPRSCLGYQYAIMSMKTVLATLVRQYRILPSEAMNDESRARKDAGAARFDANKPKSDASQARSDVRETKTGANKVNCDASEFRLKFDIMMRDVHDFVIQLALRT